MQGADEKCLVGACGLVGSVDGLCLPVGPVDIVLKQGQCKDVWDVLAQHCRVGDRHSGAWCLAHLTALTPTTTLQGAYELLFQMILWLPKATELMSGKLSNSSIAVNGSIQEEGALQLPAPGLHPRLPWGRRPKLHMGMASPSSFPGTWMVASCPGQSRGSTRVL